MKKDIDRLIRGYNLPLFILDISPAAAGSAARKNYTTRQQQSKMQIKKDFYLMASNENQNKKWGNSLSKSMPGSKRKMILSGKLFIVRYNNMRRIRPSEFGFSL